MPNLIIVERLKLWIAISLTVILIGTGFFIAKGLNFGIDFTSGTIVTISVGQSYNVDDVRIISDKYDKESQVQALEGNEVQIRSNKLTDEQISNLFNDIKAKYNLKDTDLKSTDRVGPSIGSDLKQKAIISSVAALALILLYISIRFEFKSAVTAIIALIHDVLITLSVYAIFQIPINSSFIAAVLTIIGYSTCDTVVVYDRIRENKKKGKYKDFTQLANASISQTIVRSVSTVLTVLFTITALSVFGVSDVKAFAFPMIVGIASGSYSSIFIASPLWVVWKKNEIIA